MNLLFHCNVMCGGLSQRTPSVRARAATGAFLDVRPVSAATVLLSLVSVIGCGCHNSSASSRDGGGPEVGDVPSAERAPDVDAGDDVPAATDAVDGADGDTAVAGTLEGWG